jgi:lipoate-protein ligase B
VPCGIPDKPVTSVFREKGPVKGEEMEGLLVDSLEKELNLKIERTGNNELTGEM